MQLRVAIPTKADKGLEDVVSEVFGKAKTFTIVEVEDGQIRNVQVIDNPGASYEYGSGPIAVKSLRCDTGFASCSDMRLSNELLLGLPIC